MPDLLAGIAVGIAAAAVVYMTLRRRLGRPRQPASTTTHFASIEQMRSVGELSVFKVFTKEIVTEVGHDLGAFGRKYLQWVLSSKKMAMIFAFEIDFRYNLQDPEFRLTEDSPGVFRLGMPKCLYEIYIKGIQIYDEKRATFMPWLLPGILHGVFGPGFDEADKNRLIEEAKTHASQQARDLVTRMRSEVHHSAQQTLETLARGFGAQRVIFDFQAEDLVQLSVQYDTASQDQTQETVAA